MCHAITSLQAAFDRADVFVNINNDQKELILQRLRSENCGSFQLHVETERAGVGCAIRAFSESLHKPVDLVIVLGDIIFDRAFPGWLRREISRSEGSGGNSLVVVQRPRSATKLDYDAVCVAEDGDIVAAVPRQDLTNTQPDSFKLYQVGGVIWLCQAARKVLGSLPRNSSFLDVIRILLINQIRTRAACYEGLIDDFGTSDRLRALKARYK